MSREFLEASIGFWEAKHADAVREYDRTPWWKFRLRRYFKNLAIECKARYEIQTAQWVQQWWEELS